MKTPSRPARRPSAGARPGRSARFSASCAQWPLVVIDARLPYGYVASVDGDAIDFVGLANVTVVREGENRTAANVNVIGSMNDDAKHVGRITVEEDINHIHQ